MRLTIAYSKIKKRNLVLINNVTHQRETLSVRLIRQPLKPKQVTCLQEYNLDLKIRLILLDDIVLVNIIYKTQI